MLCDHRLALSAGNTGFRGLREVQQRWWGTSLGLQAPWLASELWQLLLLEGELKTFKKYLGLAVKFPWP